MTFTNDDKEMVACLVRHFEKELDELRNDQYGHQEIVSDMKESCREKINWLEKLQKAMEEELAQADLDDADPHHLVHKHDMLIPADTYDALRRLGILDTSVRSHNVGESDYSQHIIQPWSVIQEYRLNYWDGDIIKRVLRHKQGDPHRLRAHRHAGRAEEIHRQCRGGEHEPCALRSPMQED